MTRSVRCRGEVPTARIELESRRPLTRRRCAHSTSPRTRGEVKQAISFSRCILASEFSARTPRMLLPPNKSEGRRSAEKAQLSRGASPRDQMLPPARASGAAARPAGRARLSALHRGSRQAVTPRLSPGPRFLEPPGANGRTLPGASAASSSRTGRNAGRAGPQGRPGAVCETARGHRTRPASQIASGMRPFDGRVDCPATASVTAVKDE